MNDNALLLVAAGWDDIITALVPFVFLVIWVISQLAEAKKRAEQPPKPQPGAPPQPHPPAPARQARGPGDQVEEFLRRAGRPPEPAAAAGRELNPFEVRQPQRQPPAKPVEEIEVLLSDVMAPSQRGPLGAPLRPLDEREGAPPEKRPAPGRRRAPRRPLAPKPGRESVTQHVADRLDSARRALSEHAARLGDRVIQADEQFDVELKAKFDRRIGTLASERDTAQQEQAPVSGDTPAAQIAAMLADPAGVRQAIILMEVLRRPVDRW